MGDTRKEIANLQSHRELTLKCLNQNITPTSIKLKSNIKTPLGAKSIKKAEEQLMNEKGEIFQQHHWLLHCIEGYMYEWTERWFRWGMLQVMQWCHWESEGI